MKKTNFMEEHMATALKQAEMGTPVQEVIRKMGVFVVDGIRQDSDKQKIREIDPRNLN